MTLPTGSISMSQVNQELQRPATQAISLNDSQVRQLAGVGSGAIQMHQLRGKSWLTFSGVPQAVQGEMTADFAIQSNMPVAWTFSAGHAEANIASGGTTDRITFTLRARRQGAAWVGLQTVVNVTARGYGVERSWSVMMEVSGNNGEIIT